VSGTTDKEVYNRPTQATLHPNNITLCVKKTIKCLPKMRSVPLSYSLTYYSRLVAYYTYYANPKQLFSIINKKQ